MKKIIAAIDGLKYSESTAKYAVHLAEKGKNMLVVLGAYRRGFVSRWFKPSMADNLMQELKLPLFIAHNK